MENKTLYKIDFMILFGSVIISMILIGYVRPLAIAPESNESSIVFVFEKTEFILIDDNLNFTSPETIKPEENLVINFKPGKYYWKTEGEIKDITILSEINLRIKSNGEKYELVNSGEKRLNVEVFDKGVSVKKNLIGARKEKEASGIKTIGSENE